jgi:hypothetical protein
MPIWTLENALAIIRAIAPIAKNCNFYVALRGGVLNCGESDSDLDLCFLSREDPDVCSPRRLLQELTEGIRDQIDHCDALQLDGGYPYAVIWLRDGRHIDAQFWI